MSNRPDNSVSSSAASGRQKPCADCGRPLTAHEQYLGDACEECEREYLLDTLHPDDDQYPRAA